MVEANMLVNFQSKLRLLVACLFVAAGAIEAKADGLGLFGSCGNGCDSAACDSWMCDDACGDPLCCDSDPYGSMGCDSACGCSTDRFLAGLIRPSDRCFDDFISPMINFVHFEDPRNLTELLPIFVNHWVP
ncbi:MAG: hypothetical protein AAF802_22615, partial [Planctomycetota bacterium]